MKFAVILGSNVVNIISADSKEVAEEATGCTCIEFTDENPVGIGFTYDGIQFIAPVFESVNTLENASNTSENIA